MVALVISSLRFLVLCLKSTTLGFDMFELLRVIKHPDVLGLASTARGDRASRGANENTPIQHE